MGEKAKAPAIRFKDFTDSWEQRKLGDSIVESTERTSDFKNYPLYSLTIENGVTAKTERYERGFLVTKGTELFKVVSPQNFVTNPMNLRFGAVGFNRNSYKISVSGYYDVFSIDSNECSEFWNEYLKILQTLKKYDDVATGSLIEKRRVHFSELKKIDFLVPKDIEEKKKIGEYFKNLDNLITLHQRKFEKLQNVKKAMLEKMFPKNGSNVPEIRFAGFTDAWEQRKLGDLVERIVRKNTSNESTLPLTISAQYGLVDQITYFNNRVASRDVSNYYLVLNGEFAYNKSTSNGYPFGTVKRLDLYEKGVLSTLYIVFGIKNVEDINSNFLATFFDTNRWHKGVAERAAEGARNHGLLNISADDFLDIDLLCPKEEPEQAQIGSFFQQLDNLITLHQRKLEKLQNVKKACLEKMFV